MALSFLSLPPEVRIQIYRYLLCHSTWIQPHRACDMYSWPFDIQARTRGMSLLTSFEPEPSTYTKYSPESAILRTCRMIYAEAMPVLYGENTFLYPCCRYVLTSVDYQKAGFPDKNLDFMKHLEFDVQENEWNVDSTTTKSIVSAIQYFVRGSCDLRTFKLSLYENWQMSDRGKYKDRLVNKIITSSELSASLVALQVFESLTVSIWCVPYDTHYDGENGKRLRDGYQGHVNRLASGKHMTAIMEVDLPEEEADDDSEEEDDDSEEAYGYDVCKMSWCLRPQSS